MIDVIKWNPKQLEGLKLLSSSVKKYIMFWGGSRSGKTFEVIRAIRIRCHKYPGSKHLVVRYSFANAKKTIWLQTMLPEFKKDVALGLCKIAENEGIIKYKNGSIVLLGGLEPSKIDSVLAAEYGTIFITEANENKFEVVENLFSRLNDTSKDKDGNPIKLKLICDLNPTVDRNWTNILFVRGLDPITMKPRENYHEFAHLHFKPEDNEANLSAGYIDSLKSLSPAKRKRFYEGVAASYDGLVYQLDESVHIVDDFHIPASWLKIRAVDFGYTHPFVCLWIAYDSANDCAYVYREHVQIEMTVRRHAEVIKEYSILDLPEETRKDKESWKMAEKLYRGTICDHDAEDRATLEECGINNVLPANKEVLAGIDHVIDLLDHTQGRRTRVKIFRSCSSTLNGGFTYRWKNSEMSGKRHKDREVVKEDDDEMDAMRYGLTNIFPITKGFEFIKIGAGGKIDGSTKAAEKVSEIGNLFNKLRR